MTIAACHLSSEGVVFGADSTSTIYVPGPGAGSIGSAHHYNYAQKIFQLGEQSTLGIALWGLGSLLQRSHRTLVAQFSDRLQASLPATMHEVAEHWNNFFWNEYTSCCKASYQRVQSLLSQQSRTPAEDEELQGLKQTFTGGFCIGGNLPSAREPRAFEILYDPTLAGPKPIRELAVGTTNFWGCPNVMERLLFGVDLRLLEVLLCSGKWTGTPQELLAAIVPFRLAQPFNLPLREAIDWVYASIYITNQVMKFSHLMPICGGPVEIAVITTDRPFRWVRHKRLDAAIDPYGSSDGS